MQPLTFPAPPVAPHRSASVHSWQSIEPSIDELQQEISQLKQDVADINTSLLDIELIRDQCATADVSAAELLHPLRQLSSLTTTTGSKILSISAPLASVSTRVARLSERAEAGLAAATTLEVTRSGEELEVVKQSVKEATARVRSLAQEEGRSRAADIARWEQRIRDENTGMADGAVKLAVKQMLESARTKVAKLDVSSYAGRFAAEHPFTELAQLVDNATQLHRSVTESDRRVKQDLNRTPSQATLVGSIQSSAYAKLDETGHDDLESQPLAAFNLGDGADGQRSAGWGLEGQQKTVGKMAGLAQRWAYWRAHWRDALVRVLLVTSVLGTIVGILVAATVQKNNSDAEAGYPVDNGSPIILRR